jgi:hypothetical protein
MRFLERLAALFQPVVPARLFWRVHGLVAAVITPVRFTYLSGHFRSSIVHRPIDKGGNPSPWMTYPIINFLEGKDFAEKRVLEWGAGQSTLWWSERAKQVVSYEADPSWFEVVRSRAPANVTLRLVNENVDAPPVELRGERFDVIVVDGLDRLGCARASIDLLAEDGALILDDAEQPWSEPGYPILDLMRQHGFQRIDFFGHAPAVIRRHCTSVFFKERCFLLLGTENPRRYD